MKKERYLQIMVSLSKAQSVIWKVTPGQLPTMGKVIHIGD